MSTINLTQHASTPEQASQGVRDLTGSDKREVMQLLTFEEMPDLEEIEARAETIATIAGDQPVTPRAAMIGGAPYLMGPLIAALKSREITPVFAFSKRESVEVTNEDGTVTKQSRFRHLGFIEV